MSDSPPRQVLTGTSLRAIAEGHGIDLDPELSEALAQQLRPQLARLREITEDLRADDDMLAFRRLLEQEAARG